MFEFTLCTQKYCFTQYFQEFQKAFNLFIFVSYLLRGTPQIQNFYSAVLEKPVFKELSNSFALFLKSSFRNVESGNFLLTLRKGVEIIDSLEHWNHWFFYNKVLLEGQVFFPSSLNQENCLSQGFFVEDRNQSFNCLAKDRVLLQIFEKLFSVFLTEQLVRVDHFFQCFLFFRKNLSEFFQLQFVQPEIFSFPLNQIGVFEINESIFNGLRVLVGQLLKTVINQIIIIGQLLLMRQISSWWQPVPCRLALDVEERGVFKPVLIFNVFKRKGVHLF